MHNKKNKNGKNMSLQHRFVYSYQLNCPLMKRYDKKQRGNPFATEKRQNHACARARACVWPKLVLNGCRSSDHHFQCTVKSGFHRVYCGSCMSADKKKQRSSTGITLYFAKTTRSDKWSGSIQWEHDHDAAREAEKMKKNIIYRLSHSNRWSQRR